jgi:GTPase SAR1 family protein
MPSKCPFPIKIRKSGSPFNVAFFAENCCTGKSCLLTRIERGSFFNCKPTIRLCYKTIKAKNMNGVLTDVRLLDYPSQERFRSMVYPFLANIADLSVLAYDCTDRFTFEAVPGTIKMLSDRGMIIKG